MKQRHTLYKLNKDVYFALNAIFATQQQQERTSELRIEETTANKVNIRFAKRAKEIVLWHKQRQYCH